MPNRPSRRTALALVVAAIVLAACASADGGGVSVGDAPLAPGATDTPAAEPGQPGGQDATPGQTPSPVPGGAPDTPAPSETTVVDEPPTTTSAPAPAPGEVGDYATFYLRPSESAAIRVDVRSQAGAEPGDGTVGHVRQVLGQVSGKAVDTGGGAIPGGARDWTSDAIRALADDTGIEQSRDVAVMHVFFLRGGFAESDTVLGVAVRSDVAAIFSDRVDEAAGLVGNASRIEDAVTIHEVGHLLGLVDLVLATGRADPEHPGHSPNRDSVMYYAVESTLVASLLDGGPPTDFDRADLADLATIRNG